MLTLKDCIGLCDLSEEEILAIADHEHLPEIVATELGNYLIHSPEGVPTIKAMIVDDIRAAEARGDVKRSLELKMVLRHFVQTHRELEAA
ncbi:MAG: hypothetical protein HY521_05015 [Proteobacteria bacterium]|nr:hypothetical protein [Pseudomonadota bacterium]